VSKSPSDLARIEVVELRDYFAAKALPAILDDWFRTGQFPDENWRVAVAMEAYLMADAMLKGRKR
jgi:hypothetical protein